MVSNARKNVLASYANTAATSLAGLIVNPLLLSVLGPFAFGSLKALQRFFDVGGAANGGATQALKWTTAYRNRDVDMARRQRDVGAAMIVLLIWSPVLFGVAAFILFMLPVLVRDIPGNQLLETYVIAGLLGINMLVSSIAALPDAVLVGSNQGYRSMTITTAVTLLVNAGMVVVAVVGAGLPGIGFVILAGTVINGVLTLLAARRRISWLRVRRPNRAEVHELSKFSGWVLAWSITNRFTLASEVILFGSLVGVTAVSSYTFTGYVVQFALAACLMTTSAQMPQLGALLGAGNYPAVASRVRGAREVAIALATGFACIAALLNESFVTLWAGPAQFLGPMSNALMVVAFFQLAVIRMDGQIQDTGLKIRPKVIAGIAALLLSYCLAIAAYLMTSRIESIFVGLIVGRLAASILFPLLANRTVRMRSWPYGRVAAGAVLVAAAISASQWIDLTSWIQLVAGGLLASLAVGLTVAFIVLSPSTRRALITRRKRH